MSSNATKAERIKKLRLYDDTDGGTLALFDQPGASGLKVSEPKRSKHCVFRLLNVLFANEFSTRFAEIGKYCTALYSIVQYCNMRSNNREATN